MKNYRACEYLSVDSWGKKKKTLKRDEVETENSPSSHTPALNDLF